MTDFRTALSKSATALDLIEKELIAQEGAALSFLESEHKSEDSKQYINLLRKSETKINRLRGALTELKSSSDFREETENLCKRCSELGSYSKDIRQALSDDLIELRLAEDKKSVDVIKYATFLVGVPAALVGAVKSGLGNGAIDADQAAWGGFLLSLGIITHKKIKAAFTSASRSVYRTRRQIGDSFVVFYVRDMLGGPERVAGRLFLKHPHALRPANDTILEKVVCKLANSCGPDISG